MPRVEVELHLVPVKKGEDGVSTLQAVENKGVISHLEKGYGHPQPENQIVFFALGVSGKSYLYALIVLVERQSLTARKALLNPL